MVGSTFCIWGNVLWHQEKWKKIADLDKCHPRIEKHCKESRKQVERQSLSHHLLRHFYSQNISRILLQKSWSCQITRKDSSNPDLLSVVVLQRAALGLLKFCVHYVQKGQSPGNVCSLHPGWPTCQWLTRIQSRSPVPCSRQDKLCNVIYISKLPHTSGWGCQKFHFCLVSFPFHLCFLPSLPVSLGSMSSLNYLHKDLWLRV